MIELSAFFYAEIRMPQFSNTTRKIFQIICAATPYLRPDAKAQVIFDYQQCLHRNIFVRCQHTEDVPAEALRIVV